MKAVGIVALRCPERLVRSLRLEVATVSQSLESMSSGWVCLGRAFTLPQPQSMNLRWQSVPVIGHGSSLTPKANGAKE